MKFTSLLFFIFFLVLYLIHWRLKEKVRTPFLVLASFIFYGAWSVPFLIHFWAIVTINHILNQFLLKNQKSKIFYLILGINLTNLFFFKYLYFFIKTLGSIFISSDLSKLSIDQFFQSSFGFEEIVLPLAISFYTFQMIAYTVDIYRQEAPENPTYSEYILFIMFFPQLVAGPIVRHGEFFSQLKNWNAKDNQIDSGIYFILMGLIKKVILSDSLSPLIDPVFHNPSEYNGAAVALCLFGFMARIFFDFSGYTDLARGFGKLLGIELPENFNAPYFSRSISELWTRWHITLSTWIKDYIYIPLGGSRVSEIRQYLNLIITFSLAGLWHGANLTFLVWGFIHGIILSLERNYFAFQKKRDQNQPPKKPSLVRHIFGIAYCFCLFTITIPFFNGPDIDRSFILLQKLGTWAGGNSIKNPDFIVSSIAICFALNGVQYYSYNRVWEINQTKTRFLLFAFAMLTVWLLGLFTPEGTEFIYFQF